MMIALMMMASTTPVSATTPTLTEWLQALAAEQPAELAFVETRDSGLLSEPLTVRGRLHRDGNRLIRQADSPRNETHILSERYVEVRREGGYRQRFSLHRAPELAALREALLATLDGDSERLAAHFDTELLFAEDGYWSLSLAPRDTDLATRVAMLELRGQHQQIESLSLSLVDGDRIVTRFDTQP
jgi:hypothetical protein